jgi:hypothetical protein
MIPARGATDGSTGRLRRCPEDRNGTTRASPTYLRVGTVLTAVNDAARRLRRWPTAIIDRGSARRWWNSGRDEETARSQTKKQMRA